MRKGEKKKGEKKKGEKKKSGEGKARQQTGFQSKYKEKSHLLIALEARCKVAEPDVFAEVRLEVEEWNQNCKPDDFVTFIDLSLYESLPLYFEATDEFLEKRASAKPPDIPGDWKTKVFGVNPGVHVRGDVFWFAAFTAALEGGAFLYEGITSENYSTVWFEKGAEVEQWLSFFEVSGLKSELARIVEESETTEEAMGKVETARLESPGESTNIMARLFERFEGRQQEILARIRAKWWTDRTTFTFAA